VFTLVTACTSSEPGSSTARVEATIAALLSDAGDTDASSEPQHEHAPVPTAGSGALPVDPPDAAAADAGQLASDAQVVDASADAAPDASDDPDELDGGSEPNLDAGGGGEPHDHAAEHCNMQMPADPRDLTLDPTPVILPVGRSRDVLLPQPIIDWMGEQGWEPAHDAWHSTRRWDARCGSAMAPAEGCGFAAGLIEDGLWRAQYQQGAPGAGLAFLHMHRHMIRMFEAAFPTHPELFAGFTHVPRMQEDPENPTPWRALRWTDDDLLGFDVLERIEEHVDQFPTDDELGLFIEGNLRWTPEDPTVRVDLPGSGVHGALHGQWTVNRSPGSLGAPATSMENYTFWKLHGFIDDVWTRYRAAKGLRDTDPEYVVFAEQECQLMYHLIPEHRASAPMAAR
jgi:hypothetical protein